MIMHIIYIIGLLIFCANTPIFAQKIFDDNKLSLFAKEIITARQIQINLDQMLYSSPWKTFSDSIVIDRQFRFFLNLENYIIVRKFLNINQDTNIIVFEGSYIAPIHEYSYLLAFNRQGGLYCLNGFDTNHFVQYMCDRWKPILDTAIAIDIARQYVLTVQYSPFNTRYVVESDSTIRAAGGYGYAQLPKVKFDGLAYSVVLYTYNEYTREVVQHQVRIKWNGDREAAYVRYWSSVIREAE